MKNRQRPLGVPVAPYLHADVPREGPGAEERAPGTLALPAAIT